MCDEMARIQFDVDLVSGLAHFHAPPNPGDRDRVANGVHRNVSFHVHGALMQTIDFGNPRRQWFQLHARWGSAFSTRWISGTLVEFERRTLRTLRRDSCNTRAISRLVT